MLNFKETFSLSFLLRVIIQARADTDNLQLKASENSKLSFTQLLFHLVYSICHGLRVWHPPLPTLWPRSSLVVANMR